MPEVEIIDFRKRRISVIIYGVADAGNEVMDGVGVFDGVAKVGV